MPETHTSRVHRTWFEKLRLWRRAYETKIIDQHYVVTGRGPTSGASQKIAERLWVAENPPKNTNQVEDPSSGASRERSTSRIGALSTAAFQLLVGLSWFAGIRVEKKRETLRHPATLSHLRHLKPLSGFVDPSFHPE